MGGHGRDVAVDARPDQDRNCQDCWTAPPAWKSINAFWSLQEVAKLLVLLEWGAAS